METKKYLTRNRIGKTRQILQYEYIQDIISNQDSFQTKSGNLFKIEGVEYNLSCTLIAFTGYILLTDKPDKKYPVRWDREGINLSNVSHFDRTQFDLVIKETISI